MDPSFSGSALDPSKCSKLNINEKRELVYEFSKWSQGGPDMLQSWSRKDLLEVLCAEMGKERKYTGVTKQKLIEHLLKIVTEKKAGMHMDEIESTLHPPNLQSSSKRQRKTDHPSRLPVGINYVLANDDSEPANSFRYCRNIACRATLGLEDVFCRRCSCCICYTYDDNKDPSLWLVCSSDPPSEGDSCGMSCHLECALKHERVGITKGMNGDKLDGSFYCVSCGKINDLLRCWRKQLLIAKDARRVDILCHRVSLSHKLLDGTEKYQNLHQIVDDAIKKLEAEVGPLQGLQTGMGRGIVNRLSSGAEVQKLCGAAVDLVDSMLSTESHFSPKFKLPKSGLLSTAPIRFEDICSTSITIVLGLEDDTLFSEVLGHNLWHRKVDAVDYPVEPTCRLFKPNRKFIISELTPATDYLFKVTVFGSEGDMRKWEVGATTSSIPKDDTRSMIAEGVSLNLNCTSSKTNSSDLSNPSEGDESNNSAACGDLNKLPDDDFEHYDIPEIPDRELPNNGTEVSCSQAMPEATPAHSVSALDEELNATVQSASHRNSMNSDQNRKSSTHECGNGLKSPVQDDMIIVMNRQPESVLPVTPSKLEACKEGSGRNCRMKTGTSGLEEWFPRPVKDPATGSLSKKKSPGKGEEMLNMDGSLEGDYEYCVKVIRWLECKGHIETNFRVKFLTWFSLRATLQERKVVSVFVDTLIDDPPSLAGQLVDTFSEGISRKRPPAMLNGFCMKLWH